MPKFLIKETITTDAKSARLGSGAGAGNGLTDKDVGKFVKLVGESRIDLADEGDRIEGFLSSVETATVDGYAFGGYVSTIGTYKEVTFNETVAIGDHVVVGTVTARGVASGTPPGVLKADDNDGGTFTWRVVSLGNQGTGASGTAGVIERIS
jgi:hypothetical protein